MKVFLVPILFPIDFILLIYFQISGSNFEKAHPIMGIAVMALALINVSTVKLNDWNTDGSFTVADHYENMPIHVQSNLVISNSLISNHPLSRSENLVPVLT